MRQVALGIEIDGVDVDVVARPSAPREAFEARKRKESQMSALPNDCSALSAIRVRSRR